MIHCISQKHVCPQNVNGLDIVLKGIIYQVLNYGILLHD